MKAIVKCGSALLKRTPELHKDVTLNDYNAKQRIAETFAENTKFPICLVYNMVKTEIYEATTTAKYSIDVAVNTHIF